MQEQYLLQGNPNRMSKLRKAASNIFYNVDSDASRDRVSLEPCTTLKIASETTSVETECNTNADTSAQPKDEQEATSHVLEMETPDDVGLSEHTSQSASISLSTSAPFVDSTSSATSLDVSVPVKTTKTTICDSEDGDGVARHEHIVDGSLESNEHFNIGEWIHDTFVLEHSEQTELDNERDDSSTSDDLPTVLEFQQDNERERKRKKSNTLSDSGSELSIEDDEAAHTTLSSGNSFMLSPRSKYVHVLLSISRTDTKYDIRDSQKMARRSVSRGNGLGTITYTPLQGSGWGIPAQRSGNAHHRSVYSTAPADNQAATTGLTAYFRTTARRSSSPGYLNVKRRLPTESRTSRPRMGVSRNGDTQPLLLRAGATAATIGNPVTFFDGRRSPPWEPSKAPDVAAVAGQLQEMRLGSDSSSESGCEAADMW